MKLVLQGTRNEASDTESFLFQPRQPLKWQAGQFLKYTLWHADPDDRGTERYFSIATAPHEGKVMLTTRFADRSSSFKRALRAMKAGDEIEADELEGDFVIDDPQRDHIFVAGGIGITPFRSILLDLDHRQAPINVVLLYANRNPELPYQRELEGLRARHTHLKIEYFINPRRINAEVMRELEKTRQDPMIYVSGPEPMVEAFDKMLSEMGVPEARIKNDFFPGYDWPGDERVMPAEA